MRAVQVTKNSAGENELTFRAMQSLWEHRVGRRLIRHFAKTKTKWNWAELIRFWRK